MKPKFKVSLDVNEFFDGEYDVYRRILENVAPESLSLQCPHCGVYSTMRLEAHIKRADWRYDLICTCSHCEESMFAQAEYLPSTEDDIIAPSDSTALLSIYPRTRKVDIPPEIQEKYGDDYRQAILVLELSPKASAALSRGILQNVIREEFGISHKSLDKEIDDFIKLEDVPSSLAESVDAIRVIGNFAAHPIKDTNTGEIVDVEPGEAEWLLDVLEQLFDFAIIQPQRRKEKRDNLNTKLRSAGKPELKTPKP